VLGVTLLALAVCNSAGAARAAAAACGKTPGLVCSTIDVPLDRTSKTPGTISLHVEMLPPAGVARGAVFLIAGGPGQPSAGVFSLGTASAAASYRSLFPGYTLIAYDTRGTGRSGPIDCPSFNSSGDASFIGASCASTLGPPRDFYGTGDQAEDLDLVRQTLGFDRVALWGTSYGTKLALAYALAHPSHVERLLLDSVVPTALPDPLGANMLREIPTALSNFCASTTCKAVEPDYAGDVVALANAFAATPLTGRVLLPDGSKRTETLSGFGLISMVVAADLNPGLAAELPAAVRAARHGNAQPLLHLQELGNSANSGSSVNFNDAVYAATLCHDGPFPWLPTTPLGDRPGLLQAAIDGLPSGSLGPFGHWATGVGYAGLCLDWPSAIGGTALGPGPLPDVPVLALSGGFDMRTPTVDARSVVALFPQGQLVVVPGLGHAILESGAVCPQKAVLSWLAGKSVPEQCPRPKPLVVPVAAYPASSAQRVGPKQTLGIAASTIREAEAAWVLLAESGVLGVTAPGIYGGTLRMSVNTLNLARYSITPGVTLTGTLHVTAVTYPLIFSGTVTVAGSTATAGRVKSYGDNFAGTFGSKRFYR
jgi:pimeloyl-ACP methyl ester carboxylesterase